MAGAAPAAAAGHARVAVGSAPKRGGRWEFSSLARREGVHRARGNRPPKEWSNGCTETPFPIRYHPFAASSTTPLLLWGIPHFFAKNGISAKAVPPTKSGESPPRWGNNLFRERGFRTTSSAPPPHARARRRKAGGDVQRTVPAGVGGNGVQARGFKRKPCSLAV
eukprot:gene17478-biopygen20378